MRNVQRRPGRNNGNRKAQHFWPTTKRLIAYLRPWKYGVLFSIVLAIGSVILSILAPKILGEATTIIYNGVMKGYAEIKAGQHLTSLPIDFHRIMLIGVTVILLYVFSGLFSFVQQIIMTRISQRVVYTCVRTWKIRWAGSRSAFTIPTAMGIS